MPDGDFHAAVWDVAADGTVLGPIELPAFPGYSDSEVTAINNIGIIGHAPPFIVLPGRPIAELPPFPPLKGVNGLVFKAHGMNSAGDVVGEGYEPVEFIDPTGELKVGQRPAGAIWHVNADDTISGPISTGDFYPHDINESGAMAGTIGASEAALAWFEADGTLQVMPLFTPDDYSEAFAINNSETVVGYVYGDNGWRQAYRWTPENGVELLGTIGGRSGAVALDVNDTGQIVGHTVGGSYHKALLWQEGTVFELNKLINSPEISNLHRANAINDAGQIACNATVKKGGGDTERHGVLLSPITP